VFAQGQQVVPVVGGNQRKERLQVKPVFDNRDFIEGKWEAVKFRSLGGDESSESFTQSTPESRAVEQLAGLSENIVDFRLSVVLVLKLIASFPQQVLVAGCVLGPIGPKPMCQHVQRDAHVILHLSQALQLITIEEVHKAEKGIA
jgi:hypothetical protein